MYPRNFKNEPVTNMCDYGLGVVWDTETGNCEHLQFCYDNGKDETSFIPVSSLIPSKIDNGRTNTTNSTVNDNRNYILKDITGSDWKSKEYFLNAKRHSIGVNPILGLDERKNVTALKKLFFRYAAARRISFLKRSRIGSLVYNFLKRVTN